MIRQPPPPRRMPQGGDQNKWCAFHRIIGHNTNDCHTIKREIESLVAKGHLDEFLRVVELPIETAKGPPNVNEDMDELDPPEGFVGMIMGGFTRNAETYGMHSLSSAPRKRLPMVHPPITFTTADFQGVEPHDDDPIVIKLRINKYDVERVIVDLGSAANIIYGEAFRKLKFEQKDLKPFYGTLVDFINREAAPKALFGLMESNG